MLILSLLFLCLSPQMIVHAIESLDTDLKDIKEKVYLSQSPQKESFSKESWEEEEKEAPSWKDILKTTSFKNVYNMYNSAFKEEEATAFQYLLDQISVSWDGGKHVETLLESCCGIMDISDHPAKKERQEYDALKASLGVEKWGDLIKKIQELIEEDG